MNLCRAVLLLLGCTAVSGFSARSLLLRGRHIVRHSAPRLSDVDDDKLGDELAAEFRKALSQVSNDELSASDSRVLDAFVEGKKDQFTAFENDFARQLDSVQESLDARLEGELAELQGSTMDRIDAAVEALRRENARGAPAEGSVTRPAAASDGLDAALPADALVVVVGGDTPLGLSLINSLAGGSRRVRALLPEGSKAALPDGVDTAVFAAFSPSALKKSMEGVDALVVLSAGAVGAGGVEPEAVPKLMQAVPDGTRQVMFVSTHGVDRTDRLPFNLQNMMGALDKQRGSEQEMVLRAKRGVPAHSVVRFGKFKGSGAQKLELAPGDGLTGEISVDAAAATLLETFGRPEAYNASFSVGVAAAGGAGGNAPAEWDDEFLKLVGPELYRRPLKAVTADDAVAFLQDFARGFLRPGGRLTTPISVQNMDDGVLLRFQPTGAEYLDFDTEETADMKWAAAKAKGQPAAGAGSSTKSDGALLLLAESRPSPRVRVARAEMEDGVVVKEMSEAEVVARLERELKALEDAATRNR